MGAGPWQRETTATRSDRLAEQRWGVGQNTAALRGNSVGPGPAAREGGLPGRPRTAASGLAHGAGQTLDFEPWPMLFALRALSS